MNTQIRTNSQYKILYVDVDSKEQTVLRHNRKTIFSRLWKNGGSVTEYETQHGFHYKIVFSKSIGFIKAMTLYLRLQEVDKEYILGFVKGKARTLFNYRRGKNNYINENSYIF